MLFGFRFKQVRAWLTFWLLSISLLPLLGISTINQGNFSFPALMVSLLGAIILLLVVKLIFRGR